MKHSLITLLIGMVLLDIAAPRGCGNKSGSGGGGRPQTSVEGTVRFHGLNCQPGQTDFQVPPCSGPYPAYKMDIFKNDDTTLVVTVMTNSLGKYFVNLAPGDYVVYTQNGPMESNKKRNSLSLHLGESATLDLEVSTGIQ